jgi:hypothetical protein
MKLGAWLKQYMPLQAQSPEFKPQFLKKKKS